MGMGAEPEPQGEVTFSAEQKVDNFLKSKTKDHKETSPQGLSGPELQAQVRAAQCPAAPRAGSRYAGAAPANPPPRTAAPSPCHLTARALDAVAEAERPHQVRLSQRPSMLSN